MADGALGSGRAGALRGEEAKEGHHSSCWFSQKPQVCGGYVKRVQYAIFPEIKSILAIKSGLYAFSDVKFPTTQVCRGRLLISSKSFTAIDGIEYTSLNAT